VYVDEPNCPTPNPPRTFAALTAGMANGSLSLRVKRGLALPRRRQVPAIAKTLGVPAASLDAMWVSEAVGRGLGLIDRPDPALGTAMVRCPGLPPRHANELVELFSGIEGSSVGPHWLPMSEFAKPRGRANRRCPDCASEASRRDHAASGPARSARISACREEYRRWTSAFGGCAYERLSPRVPWPSLAGGCAEGPHMIDAHHLDPETKQRSVSRLVSTGSKSALLLELAKCVPLCVYHHRWLTLMPMRPAASATVRRNRERLDLLKQAAPCMDCRNRFPSVLIDYDHLVWKRMNISAMVIARRPWREIEEELTACELVCCACHRVRTHRDSERVERRPPIGRRTRAYDTTPLRLTVTDRRDLRLLREYASRLGVAPCTHLLPTGRRSATLMAASATAAFILTLDGSDRLMSETAKQWGTTIDTCYAVSRAAATDGIRAVGAPKQVAAAILLPALVAENPRHSAETLVRLLGDSGVPLSLGAVHSRLTALGCGRIAERQRWAAEQDHEDLMVRAAHLVRSLVG